ncbi:MAG: methylmalonyl Co-A mutase-associated GTPase MeaB [Sphingobacteriia bacterium 24-36-13]|jgi:LAO/AO transport system kinase|uniref:methylmalonyl Co-A mutase-associated GTPase MeaB n=1 Tax=Sediminibacterium sp. TaxID=1917865 RepID=UPI000BD3BCA5|nr:methylmalonyl Co-A mutase-associated GTPase MeaB [Sediminibacterium sp.]OYY11638.1 MAG: methylmalonyl Co-A mutase-associated GTPase MeaB [Sphingobacteriia bacterium 35-36-14]OYZ53839.1 MAG: methylmalonyl Co-A mutase-associated GTPase MeaB [Sphingobacteriia bacterium 24-36-13]OZA64489.1 MAG: methylmalonyl Co-A mutase-associated GTPase MeaB [Sphingobacteriia bacterium 39-36-14]HQS23662.1 methylmalonyl Co-A mutase-associated GTPase MeaB [Sediminibacterium sp.]HQS35563.1 methylmalonyl Co-A muta
MWKQLLAGIQIGNHQSIARAISLVENEVEGYDHFLQSLPIGKTPITGITGPPGAGKSTLTDALIGHWTAQGKKVAILCIDPSSPFNMGALLGDRIRMSDWYNHPGVYIRSLATRGSLGGLHPYIIEITAILQTAGFDEIIVETVGVGQSEIEIAGLADTTVVVVVPEAGDEVQTMKAGLMEIADVFVVNKSDRPDADSFVKNLRLMLAPAFNSDKKIEVIKTVASQKEGIGELANAITEHQQHISINNRKIWLLTERVYQLIARNRMKPYDKKAIYQALQAKASKEQFNLFTFVNEYANTGNA